MNLEGKRNMVFHPGGGGPRGQHDRVQDGGLCPFVPIPGILHKQSMLHACPK